MTAPLFVEAKKTFLKVGISAIETGEIVLNALTDIYGNQLDMANFGSIMYLTIDPGGSQEEIISATGFTVNDDNSVSIDAGIVRGLSAVSPYGSGGTAYDQSAGTVVVISNNPQVYQGVIAYVNSLVLASAVQATGAAFGYVKTAGTNKNSRVQIVLVSEQGSPNLTVAVAAFKLAANEKNLSFAGGNSASMTAPSTNPRIDLVVYDSINTVLAVRTGTPAGSPSAPTPTSGDVVLAQVFHRVGSTKILEQDDGVNSYILAWMLPALYRTDLLTSSTLPAIVPEVDQSQTTQNATSAVGQANPNRMLLGQSFLPTVASIHGVSLYKAADTGSFTGTVTIALEADSAGSPSGTALASFTIPNATWLKIVAGEFSVAFSSEYSSMIIGNKYWIVISTSVNDTSNHPNLGTNSAGGFGNLKFFETNDGWTGVTPSLYIKTRSGLLGKVVENDATSGLIPASVRPYSLVDINATAVSVGGDASSHAETVLYSKQLPGGFFTLNSGMKLRLVATCVNAIISSGGGTNTTTFKVKLNGTAILTITQTNTGTAVTKSISEDLYFVNNNSLSAQNLNQYDFTALTSAAPTTPSVDTSGPVLLELTGQTANPGGNNGVMTVTFSMIVFEKIG